MWDVELYGKLLEIGGGKERMTKYFMVRNACLTCAMLVLTIHTVQITTHVLTTVLTIHTVQITMHSCDVQSCVRTIPSKHHIP